MHKEKSVVWDGNGHDLMKSVVFVLLELEELEERSEYSKTAVFVC
jgi:hypothetical protein